MKKTLFVACCACAALAFCGRAAANVTFGITEDTGVLGDPAMFYSTLNDLGATENRIAINWDPAQPTTIPNQPGLDYWLPQATIHAVRVLFAVAPAHPGDITSSPSRINQFAAFLQQLARTYPFVKDYVIGNEPNQPRFWQPQFSSTGANLSGSAYEPLLAASYDGLKGVNPSINVIGVGLSPRGNDNPFAKDNVSTSPVRFLHDVGVAYRASKRSKPLMDELGFHPYPNQNNDPPLKGYPWPKAGIPNLDRIKQAVWDAFNGTAQPVFAERGKAAPANALKLDLDDSKRPSFASVKSAIAQTQGKCALTPPGWSHTATVNGATVAFGYLGAPKGWNNKLWRFRASVQEDATYKAGVFKLGSRKLTAKAKRAVLKSLANPVSKPLLGAKGTALAYKSKLVALPKKTLKRSGWYVYGIRLAAAMNAQRAFASVSRPFLVKTRPRARK